MTATQLSFLAPPTPDPTRDAVLALITLDPRTESERRAIVDAIRESVVDGITSANRWRPLIPAWVYSRRVGATVHALIRAGVLVPTGQWERSDDTKGRNGGKPCMRYRWRGDR